MSLRKSRNGKERKPARLAGFKEMGEVTGKGKSQ
jgi:hypothetical protein